MQQPKARVTDIGSNLKYNIRSYKYNVKPSYDTQLQSNSIIFKQNKQVCSTKKPIIDNCLYLKRLMVGLSFYATNDCFDVEFSQLQQLIKQKSSKPDYLSSVEITRRKYRRRELCK
eukprot:19023_1